MILADPIAVIVARDNNVNLHQMIENLAQVEILALLPENMSTYQHIKLPEQCFSDMSHVQLVRRIHQKIIA